MENPVISLSVGGCLIVGGLLLMRHHRLAWQIQKHVTAESDQQRRSFRLRYRRRMQIAGILIVIGIMIPVGDLAIDWKPRQGLFAFYWMTVILLCFWMILLALGDVLSIRARSRVDLAMLETKRRALERELHEHQQRRTENGQL